MGRQTRYHRLSIVSPWDLLLSRFTAIAEVADCGPVRLRIDASRRGSQVGGARTDRSFGSTRGEGSDCGAGVGLERLQTVELFGVGLLLSVWGETVVFC